MMALKTMSQGARRLCISAISLRSTTEDFRELKIKAKLKGNGKLVPDALSGFGNL
jgi:hypothetical protein